MWSNVNEHIIDGVSGLNPNESPIALIVGTCSKDLKKPISLGKNSNIDDLLGIGEMPRRIKDMQMTMSDCSIIAVKSDGDINGIITEIFQSGDVSLTIVGNPKGFATIKLSVQSPEEITIKNSQNNSSNLETAKFALSIEGDIKIYEEGITFEDGIYTIEELGIALQFELNSNVNTSCSWEFSTKSPKSSYAELEEKITQCLELYTPEFIFVAQEIDSNDAKLFGSFAEKLFEEHKPCFFLLESNLDQKKSIGEAISTKKEEFSKINARFISIVCQDGFVLTREGKEYRSPSGLCAGHITRASVNKSIGSTNEFSIHQYELPYKWTNSDSRSLDESKFITLRTYAGLDNLFWANGRTFAEDKSDYRFIEIVRTVFKSIRLARRACLPYIQSPGNEIGIQNLLADVRNSINYMTEVLPKELDYFNVSIPENQDISNNGIILNIELFGIPIIRTITLNFLYKYEQ